VNTHFKPLEVSGIVRGVRVVDEQGSCSFDLERPGEPTLRIEISGQVAEDDASYIYDGSPVVIHYQDSTREKVTRVAEARPW
jgi:hypothetical protein